MNNSTNNWSRKKLFIFSIIIVVLFILSLETLSFLYFYLKGSTGNDPSMTFHPLFRKTSYKMKGDILQAERFVFDPFLGYRYQSGTSYGSLSINAHGFINNGGQFPDLMKKPPGTTRIFLLGGSSLAGSGASSNKTTIASRMEEILNKESKGKYEVINAGVDGYFSFNQLGYFLSDIVNYHPDIIIFYDGWNDYAYPVWAGGYKDDYQKLHGRANHHEYALYLQTVLPKMQDESRIINTDFIVDKTYFTMLLKKLYSKITKTRPIGSTIDVRNITTRVRLKPEEAAGIYTTNVESAVGAVASHRLKVIYALQPTILDKQNLTPEEKEFFRHRDALTSESSNSEKIKKYYEKVRADYSQMEMKYRNHNYIRVIDMSAIIWEGITNTVYLDEIHTNDYGNQIIATRLADIVNTSLKD